VKEINLRLLRGRGSLCLEFFEFVPARLRGTAFGTPASRATWISVAFDSP